MIVVVIVPLTLSFFGNGILLFGNGPLTLSRKERLSYKNDNKTHNTNINETN